MAGEPEITIVGNATSEAELRFLSNGAAVCKFTVAHTPRTKQGDTWVDGQTTFYRCAIWRDAAEPAAESITKGMRLIVHGRLKFREYEKDGQTRQSIEIDVDEVGPSLRYATAKVQKMQRSGGQNSGGEQRQPARTGGGQLQGGGGFDNDPWASQEPPF